MAGRCRSCGSFAEWTVTCKECGTVFCNKCRKESFFSSERDGINAIGTELFGKWAVRTLESKECPSCGTENGLGGKNRKLLVLYVISIPLIAFVLLFLIGMLEQVQEGLGIGIFLLLVFIGIPFGIIQVIKKQFRKLEGLKTRIYLEENEIEVVSGVTRDNRGYLICTNQGLKYLSLWDEQIEIKYSNIEDVKVSFGIINVKYTGSDKIFSISIKGKGYNKKIIELIKKNT